MSSRGNNVFSFVAVLLAAMSLISVIHAVSLKNKSEINFLQKKLTQITQYENHSNEVEYRKMLEWGGGNE